MRDAKQGKSKMVRAEGRERGESSLRCLKEGPVVICDVICGVSGGCQMYCDSLTMLMGFFLLYYFPQKA